MKRERGTADYLAMCRRMIRAAGRRVALEDPELFRDLIDLRIDLDAAIVDAVRGQRSAGMTWREIGQATGTSHVAAIQKWAHKLNA